MMVGESTTRSPMLDPIAKSAAKDDKRLVKRLNTVMEGLSMVVRVQAAERSFDLTHNAQGGTIRMSGDPHNQAIHHAVRELLGSNSQELRHFQEDSIQRNHFITISNG